jgi:hypothetical protein
MRRRAPDFHIRPVGLEAARQRIVVFRLLLFRPRPRHPAVPCLTAQMAPMLLGPVSSIGHPRARASVVFSATGLGSCREICALLVHNLGIAAPNERDDPALFGAANQRGLRRQPRQSGHQCFSWAISASDDGSACCEQLLHVRSSIRLASNSAISGSKRIRRRFHLGQPIADAERIQGLSLYILNSVFLPQHNDDAL